MADHLAPRGRLRVIAVLVALLTGTPGATAVASQDPQTGPSLEAILDAETTARLLAILLHAGRYVVSENQELIDDPTRGPTRFTPDVFERQLVEIFRARSGIDLPSLPSVRVPEPARRLLPILASVSKDVVADAQDVINQQGVEFKGFIPAIFGARVAARFTELTGVRLKQTALAPRNDANAPDGFEASALQEFADGTYPREKVISEVTAGSRILRLMYPLYATRRCLDCHGEPRGTLDRTGHRREGLRLGQSAGAISVTLPLRP